MYIRFESPARDEDSRVNLGIFQTMGVCLRGTADADRTWHHTEMQRELDWFREQLDAPKRLYYRVGRKTERSGICWFRDNATDHVARAHYMAWLLQELGISMRIRRSRAPGTILWQDRHQVVALPQSTSFRTAPQFRH